MKETIIVLDDSASNLQIMAKILENLGYNVLTADNGEAGFACVERCEQEKLNLVAVITDMLMPLVDGPGFAFRLREDPAYETLPVFFMTSATDKSYLLAAKKVKAAGYILKPVNPQQVASQLKGVFPGKVFPTSA